MSDGLYVAFFGFLGVLVATTPALIVTIRSSRHSIDAKESAARTAIQVANVTRAIGEPNGSGNLIDLLERLQEATAQTLRWQADHSAEDMAQLRMVRLRLAAVEQLLDSRTPLIEGLRAQVDELEAYIHTRNHDILNALAVLQGRVLLMSSDPFAPTPAPPDQPPRSDPDTPQ